MITTSHVRRALNCNDRELAATLLPLVGVPSNLDPYIDLQSRLIDFDGMLREAAWSSTEQLLVSLAARHWGQSQYEASDGVLRPITGDLPAMTVRLDDWRMSLVLASAEARHCGKGPYLAYVLSDQSLARDLALDPFSHVLRHAPRRP